MIPWNNLDDHDIHSIHKLAVRASQLAIQAGGLYPVPDASLDIAACHLHAPLDLPARPVAKVIADQGAQIREHKRATP